MNERVTRRRKLFKPEKRGIVEPAATEAKGKVIYEGINVSCKDWYELQTLRNIRIDAPS